MLEKLTTKFNETTDKEWQIIGLALVASILTTAVAGAFLGSVLSGIAIGLFATNKVKV